MNYFEETVYNDEYKVINNVISIFVLEKTCDEIHCNISPFVFRYKKKAKFFVWFMFKRFASLANSTRFAIFFYELLYF